MTLSTDMYIQGEVNLAELRQVVKEALAKHDGHRRSPDAQRWEENGGRTDTTYWRNTFSTIPDQGLPAWTIVYHGKDGAWRAPEDEYDHDVEEGEEPRFVAPRHFARIDFDTAYGYRGPNNMTCDQLHVLLMSQVGGWLRHQGVPWQWRNEYSGEIHDAFEGFETLIGNGASAQSWFRSVAEPAIEADILRSAITEESR